MADNMFDARVDENHILHKRAEAVAKVEAGAEIIGDEVAVVMFTLADENYGIELTYVREIYPIRDLTFLPGAPGFIAGIVNVRGEIFSAVNLKHFFEIEDESDTKRPQLIILESDRMAFGILADTVSGVQYISPSMLQYNVSTLTGIRSKYLKGIAEGRVILLDAKRLLEDPSMYVYQEPG